MHQRKVEDVLKGSLHVGEKSAAVSKQQLSDEFLNGFHLSEEMPNGLLSIQRQM